MKDIKSHYQTLGVSVDASLEEVKHAYRDLAKVWHPDRFTHDPALQKKAEAKLTEINIAYSTINEHLKDATSKKSAKSTTNTSDAYSSAHTAYQRADQYSSADKTTKTSHTEPPKTHKTQKPTQRKTSTDDANHYSVEPRPWFRFWARYFDLVVIGIVVFFSMVMLSPELAKKANPLIIIGVTLPLWFVIEAVVMSTFGTTPGKAILRIRVRAADGSVPEFKVFFKRGMFIWFMGQALGIPGLCFLSNFMAYLILLRDKKTTWDEKLNLVVSHGGVNDNRIGTFVALFVLVTVLFAFNLFGVYQEYKKTLSPQEPVAVRVQRSPERVVEPSPETLPTLPPPSHNRAEMMTADDWFERGRRLFVEREYQASVDALNNAIELNPQYTEAYVNRGSSYKMLGKNQQALSDYNHAIELNPKLSVAYFYRGFFYYDLNKVQQAIDDFDMAIDLNSRYAMAYLFRGLAYKAIDATEQAIEDLDMAIVLAPQDPKAFYSRAVLHNANGNDLQAISDFKVAARLGSKEARDVLAKQGIQW
ncbi:MAG: tetratricopeptide repeat protein [Candidatus Magnetobacterium sp. LHC-1]|nr:tetratricopeptide repeat protein [Nitrospirota bacterium]